jgi:hypothetical protein
MNFGRGLTGVCVSYCWTGVRSALGNRFSSNPGDKGITPKALCDNGSGGLGAAPGGTSRAAPGERDPEIRASG